jgi:hypothetical protein
VRVVDGKISYFKYVPHGFAYLWEAAGWKRLPALDDTHHGFYAALMEWAGEGDPVCPPTGDAA